MSSGTKSGPALEVPKPWGVVREIHRSPAVVVHHASIRSGGRSSKGDWHRHPCGVNDFYVVSGKLEVEVEHQQHLLGPGMILSVGPGEWHRFHALSDVELIETYTLPVVDPADIERSPLWTP